MTEHALMRLVEEAPNLRINTLVERIKMAIDPLRQNLDCPIEPKFGINPVERMVLMMFPTDSEAMKVIPEDIRKSSDDAVVVGMWDVDELPMMGERLKHFYPDKTDTSSWARSARRLWVSCAYTRYDRNENVGVLDEIMMRSLHRTNTTLHFIDPGINRLVELARLVGGDPDVSCEGHPEGAYFRIAALTPVSEEMLQLMNDMAGGAYWRLSKSDSPLAVRLKEGDALRTIHMHEVSDYATRNKILRETVEMIETTYGIGTETVPGNTNNLWCIQ